MGKVINMEGELIYIASPFTTKIRAIMIERFEQVSKCCSVLMNKGLHVFSPISHGWPIAEAGGLPTDWAYWETACKVMVSRCQRFIVVMLDGWETSTGVLAEIKYAKSLGIEIEYMDPETYELSFQDNLDDMAYFKMKVFRSLKLKQVEFDTENDL